MSQDEELDALLERVRPPLPRRGTPLDAHQESLLQSILNNEGAQPRVDDPAPTGRGDRHLVDSARTRRARLAHRSRGQRRIAGPRLTLATLPLAALALVVLLGIAAPFVGTRAPSAYAATPRPLHTQKISGDTRTVLMKMSKSIERSRSTRIEFQSWALSFDPESSQLPQSIQPEQTTIEELGDGTVTLKTIVVGTFDEHGNTLPSADGRQPGSVLMDERFAPGEFTYFFPAPEGRVDWAAYLTKGYGLPADASAGEYFTAIRGLLSERTLTAELQSSLIRFIATLPGVKIGGEVTDRLGRSGISISTETRLNGEYQDILVLSEGLGVIAYESVYVGGERTDIPSPAVIDYIAWK